MFYMSCIPHEQWCYRLFISNTVEACFRYVKLSFSPTPAFFTYERTYIVLWYSFAIIDSAQNSSLTTNDTHFIKTDSRTGRREVIFWRGGTYQNSSTRLKRPLTRWVVTVAQWLAWWNARRTFCVQFTLLVICKCATGSDLVEMCLRDWHLWGSTIFWSRRLMYYVLE